MAKDASAYDPNLAAQAVIRMPDGENMVNIREALKDGQFVVNRNFMDQHLRVGVDDPLNNTLDQLTDRIQARIEADPEMRALLEKSEWSMADRVAWEKGLTEITSEEFEKIPAFSEYRTNGVRGEYLNDSLNDDLRNGTSNAELDCEQMSQLEGILIQRVEDRMLPANAEPDNLKFAGSYFYGGGSVFYGTNGGYHGFSVSSVTGHIIEGTADPDEFKYGSDPYRVTNNTFADFVAGKPIVAWGSEHTHDMSVYGANDSEADEATIARREADVAAGRYDNLARPDRSFAEDGNTQAHFTKTYQRAQGEKPPEFEAGTPTDPAAAGPTGHDYVINNAPEANLGVFEQAYMLGSYARLENLGQIQNGEPVVYTNEQGGSYYVTRIDGEVKILDLEGFPTPEGAATVTYDPTPAVSPQPVEIEPLEPLPAEQPEPAERPAPVQRDPVAPVPPVVPVPETKPANPAVTSRMAIVGSGTQVVEPKSAPDLKVKDMQQALVDAGFDVGVYPEGHSKAGQPMVDGQEGQLTRAAALKAAEAMGISEEELRQMPIDEFKQRLEEYTVNLDSEGPAAETKEAAWDDVAVSRIYDPAALRNTDVGGMFGKAHAADPDLMQAVYRPAPDSPEYAELQELVDRRQGDDLDPQQYTKLDDTYGLG